MKCSMQSSVIICFSRERIWVWWIVSKSLEVQQIGWSRSNESVRKCWLCRSKWIYWIRCQIFPVETCFDLQEDSEVKSNFVDLVINLFRDFSFRFYSRTDSKWENVFISKCWNDRASWMSSTLWLEFDPSMMKIITYLKKFVLKKKRRLR